MSPKRVQPRRIEAGLNLELRDRPDIRTAERAALRAQARAVDVAEAHNDPDQVSRANAVYLQLREACGLTSGAAQPVDSFSAFLADLSRPGSESFDTPNH